MTYRDVNFSLQRNPLVVPAIMLATGIALGSWLIPEPWIIALVLVCMTILTLLLKAPILQTLLLYICTLVLGILLFSVSIPNRNKVVEANAIQHWVNNQYTKAGIEKHELLTAMTIGKTIETRGAVNDVRREYSTAGVAHLLALSGLHVGFFYAAVLFLAMKRRHNAVVQIVILSSVWMYVLLTGCATSTIRAGLMVSIHSLSLMLYRTPMPFNTVALSSILILLVSPLQFFDLGFILSFGAVLSILIYVPLFMPKVENRLLRWICTSVCVSLAAQIGVAPVQALIFGHISPYFLVSNLVVLPVAMVIIYGAMLVLLLSQLPVLQVFAGSVISKILDKMDCFIHYVATLPGADLNVNINMAQTMCCYVVIVAVALVIKVIRD